MFDRALLELGFEFGLEGLVLGAEFFELALGLKLFAFQPLKLVAHGDVRDEQDAHEDEVGDVAGDAFAGQEFAA